MPPKDDTDIFGLSSIIQLDVGERTFYVKLSSLLRTSCYFRDFFALPGPTPEGLGNRYHFLDLDGDAFAEVLTYIRSLNYPLYYTVDKGFDVDKYLRVQAVADYIGCEELMDWIHQEKYLQAVEKYYTTQVFTKKMDAEALIRHHQGGTAKLTSLTEIHTERSFVCPNSIEGHQGASEVCEIQCLPDLIKQNRQPPVREVQFARTTIVTEEIRTRPEVCRSILLSSPGDTRAHSPGYISPSQLADDLSRGL